MRAYLTSVFKVLYATQPGTRDSIGLSAEDLAASTTLQCFAEADTDGDGRISREECVCRDPVAV